MPNEIKKTCWAKKLILNFILNHANKWAWKIVILKKKKNINRKNDIL